MIQSLLLLLSLIPSTFSQRCFRYSGILSTSVSPSNWIDSSSNILFHLTFKKARTHNVLIVNDMLNNEWGTEIWKDLPFTGDAEVYVTYGDTEVRVRITKKGSPAEEVEYNFEDRSGVFGRTVTSITGAAEGKEVDCGAGTSPPTSNVYPCPTPKAFREEFDGDKLDGEKWLVAHKSWGGGKNGYTNGGVVLDNVQTSEDGIVVFDALGSNYEGSVKGINNDLTRKNDGKRTGGAIATKDYFGPGRYEIRFKASPEFGACSAFWTFFYKDLFDNTPIINHEIDVEIPGRPAGALQDIDFDHALLNVWVGEIGRLYTPGYTELPSRMDDGEFHTWRFDWHTGNPDPRVEFYLDGEYLRTITNHVPFYHQRIWLGVWFPGFWAGDADFDASRMEVDWVEFTPFVEERYQCPEETYPDYGWAPKTSPPTKAPTPSLDCTSFKNKKKCGKQSPHCVWGKKKLPGDCTHKNKYSTTCSTAGTPEECTSLSTVGACDWKDNGGGTCVSRCNGLVGTACRQKRGSAEKKKICRIEKVANPCHKCRSIETCG